MKRREKISGLMSRKPSHRAGPLRQPESESDEGNPEKNR